MTDSIERTDARTILIDMLDHKEHPVGKPAIVTGLRQAGLKPGDIVLVHSAMRTIGWVENGARTVVEALLDVVGTKGTVVVPTFTFKHEVDSAPVIDPENDPSEMGAISEAVRLYPGALRSRAFRHSVAAIGRQASVITEVDPRLSPFDLRSSFGVMLALNAQVLLLGVPYSNATAFHACEWLCNVPYRHVIAKPAKIRLPKRPIEEFIFTDYQPKPNDDGSYYGKRSMDFNRVGSILEESQKVMVAAIGNAVARRFSLRDLSDYARIEMEKDYNIFRTEEDETGKITALKDGKIVLVELTDGAGRTGQHQWSVIDPLRLVVPTGVRWSIFRSRPSPIASKLFVAACGAGPGKA